MPTLRPVPDTTNPDPWIYTPLDLIDPVEGQDDNMIVIGEVRRDDVKPQRIPRPATKPAEQPTLVASLLTIFLALVLWSLLKSIF